MHKRPAFTIIEVLIAIALLGIILPALYESVFLLRESNTQLFKHLQKAKRDALVTETLYLDIASSDGNISIKKDEFSRLCIENTKNSLYALSEAKVCWIVLKKENTLLRVEGYNYNLPTRFDENVEVDSVMKNIEIFDVYHKKDKVLVLLKEHAKEASTFVIYGIERPKKKKPKKKKHKIKKNSKIKQNSKNIIK